MELSTPCTVWSYQLLPDKPLSDGVTESRLCRTVETHDLMQASILTG